MRKSQLKRLRRLLVVLRTVAKDPRKRSRFHMHYAALRITQRRWLHDVLGWGGMDSVLRKQGFVTYSVYDYDHCPNGAIAYNRYGHNPLSSNSAAEAFFGVTPRQYLKLFHEAAYESPTDIAAAIRKLSKFIRERS